MCANVELQSKWRVSFLAILTLVMWGTQWTNAQACEEKELGIKVPNTNRIPDRYMTSSTQLNSKYPAFRGRIGVNRIGSWGDGWCASDSDANPYIQVYFEMLTRITVIESEGVTVDGNQMWVSSYTVSTNNDSTGSWTKYPDGNARELQANTNIQAKNVTLNDTWTHFIRIHPKTHEGKWTCMRIALYGCQTEQQGPVMFNEVLNDAPFAKTPLKETLFLVFPILVFFCVIIAGAICLSRRYRARRSHQAKQSKATKEAKPGISNVVVYEEPPPYEFQTVSLHFDHDLHDGKELQSEMPAFNDSNKIFSFDRKQN